MLDDEVINDTPEVAPDAPEATSDEAVVPEALDAPAPQVPTLPTTATGEPASIESRAYGADGKLTRKGMLLVLSSGGSVMVNQRVVTRAKDLPTEAQLAAGDAKKAAQVAAALDEQIAALQAQKSTLVASVKKAGK